MRMILAAAFEVLDPNYVLLCCISNKWKGLCGEERGEPGALLSTRVAGSSNMPEAWMSEHVAAEPQSFMGHDVTTGAMKRAALQWRQPLKRCRTLRCHTGAPCSFSRSHCLNCSTPVDVGIFLVLLIISFVVSYLVFVITAGSLTFTFLMVLHFLPMEE